MPWPPPLGPGGPPGGRSGASSSLLLPLLWSRVCARVRAGGGAGVSLPRVWLEWCVVLF